MLTSLNPFRDTAARDTRAEFRKQMRVEPEQMGDPSSSGTVAFAGSLLSHKEYNQIFEGDSWSFGSQNASIVHVNLRPMTFRSSGEENAQFDDQADRGFLGSSLGEKRSHVHYVLGEGDDSATFQGNAQRNIAVLEAGAGNKSVTLDLGGGDDKAVLFLENTSGAILVKGGEGHNSLEIVSRDPKHRYEMVTTEELRKEPGRYPSPDVPLLIITEDIGELVRRPG